MKDIYLILENCTNIINHDNVAISENVNIRGNDFLIFSAILQTANEVNGNKRIYPMSTCKGIVEGLEGQAVSRSLFQRLDHPMLVGLSEDDVKRVAGTTPISEACSIIRKIYLKEDKIIGEIQTLRNEKGRDFKHHLEDNINLGFSLRMFGKLQPSQIHEGVNEVVRPLQPITYDVVNNPSHSKARVISFLTEGKCIGQLCQSIDNKFDLLTESSMDEFLIMENTQMPTSTQENLKKFLFSLISESFDKTKVKFKI